MIRARVKANAQPLIALNDFADDFSGIVYGLAEETYAETAPNFLDELRFEPGPAVHPFEFETEKSRRYYFWAIRKGLINTQNGRYVRTGALSAGWQVLLSRTAQGFQYLVRNTTDYAKWVVGSLDQRRGARRQVPGHRNTGWPLALTTIDFWLDTIQDVFRRKFERFIPEEYGRYVDRRQNR